MRLVPSMRSRFLSVARGGCAALPLRRGSAPVAKGPEGGHVSSDEGEGGENLQEGYPEGQASWKSQGQGAPSYLVFSSAIKDSSLHHPNSVNV